MSKNKRFVEIVVISDVHLGTYGCHAKELLNYLKSIDPQIIILNGDIIDIWQFSKRFWPKSHMKIIKHIVNWISKGKEIYYITGNHDEMLRKFVGFELGSLSLVNKVVLEIDGKKAWFFHGDVFDVTMQHSKWLAKFGAVGYDTLILFNRFVNNISTFFGGEKISLSKKIKNSVKSAIKFIDDFEDTAIEIAMKNGYDYVVCGHIHHPIIKNVTNENGSVTYLNSGDWIESLTALEYNNKEWSIYKYFEHHSSKEKIIDKEYDTIDKTHKEIFGDLIADFKLKSE